MPTGVIILFSVAVVLQFVQLFVAIAKIECNEGVRPHLYVFSLVNTLLWILLWLDK